jgi:hypothetical protein
MVLDDVEQSCDMPDGGDVIDAGSGFATVDAHVWPVGLRVSVQMGNPLEVVLSLG